MRRWWKRYNAHRWAILGILSLFAMHVSAVNDSRSEISGSPASDSDLASPFSITTQTFGFPDASMPGILSFTYDIPSVTNPTSATITAQVYMANAYTQDSAGTYVMGTPQIPISGCAVTVPPGTSDDLQGSCTVTAADNAKLVNLGIVNTLNTTQSIVFGFGASAANLNFSSDGNFDSVSVTITPAPPITLAFVATAGVAVPSQIYPLVRFPNGVTVTFATAIGGSWLSACYTPASGPPCSSVSSSPGNVTVTVTPTGLAAAIYNGSVTIADEFGDTLTVPVTLTVLPAAPQYIQQGVKLLSTDPDSPDGGMFQGAAVGLSQDGNTAVVGAYGDIGGTQNGAAWIYNRVSGVWNLNTNLPSTFQSSSPLQQGHAVAISADGSVFLSGAPSGFGAAWVYGGPCASSELLGSHGSGNPGQGSAVALSGDGLTALVGGPLDNSNTGAVWVFVCSQGVWAQQGMKLVGTGALGSALQGSSVALSADGNTALFGGASDHSAAGAAWVYTRSGATWTQQAKLVTSSASGSLVGSAVALSADGNTALLGSMGDSNFLGAAWVFTRSGTTWGSSPVKLVGTNAVGTAVYQGIYVALSPDGNTAAVGGYGDNSNAGAAWIFQHSGGQWKQFGNKISGSDRVGAAQQDAVALSTDGSTLLLGGQKDNGGVGAAWAFVLSGPAPTVSSINPSEVTAGGSAFTLTLNGSNFLNGATVQWNGVPLPTTFGSVSQLTATVSASLIQFTNSFAITVVNPDGTPTGTKTFAVIAPELGITLTNTGNFVFGENNATYMVTVSNAAGAASTSGVVTMTETVPAGMTLVSMAGNGWTCATGGATCTNSTALSAGANYSSITVTVKIAAGATSPLVNQVSVSGGGSATATASDSTTVVTPSACDLNLDALTNVLDVQQLMNQALGMKTPANDLNGDHKVNAVDVQMVVNAALGGKCF